MSCFYFQHRLCWMLSSILQQKGEIPNILVNISHTDNDGNPTTKEVCDFFRSKGLNIKETLMGDNEVDNRSLARTKQLKESNDDFILFADSDMVYDPLFFSDLKAQLETNLKDETKCMAADRVSLDIPFCTEYFEKDRNKYPMVVENVVDIVSKWPVYYISGRKRGAGYFQLANVQLVKERGVEYGVARHDGFRKEDGFFTCKADRYFRINLGGIAPIITKPQYHLNHQRYVKNVQR